MPPKVKLHNRHGKLKTLPRSNVSSSPSSSSSSNTQSSVPGPSNGSNTNDAVADQQLEVEICWCIHQLEESLSSNKLTSKQAQESLNILNVLKSKTQLTVRKRQLMRMHFGDYRAKMAAEEKKAKAVQNQASFVTNKTSSKKSTFLRKSAILATGDNNFKFNFKPQIEPETSKEEKCDASINEAEKPEMIAIIPIKNDFSQLKLNSSSDFKFNFQIEDNTMD